jgi:DNA-binding Lrp family transcriptional regulator
MDDIDRAIIALLWENARRPFQDIGQHVSLSAPAVKRRVDRLEADGVIRGYTATVDPRLFGWTTQALVQLHAEGRFSPGQIRDALREHPEVTAAYSLAGAASAVVFVRTRDTEHLERLLVQLVETPAIIRTHTSVILSTLIERSFEM